MRRQRRFAFICAALAASVLLGAKCSLFNKAPAVPAVPGPTTGVAGVPVTFTATSTDPDGDSVAYQFDWGDGSTLQWSTFLASGATCTTQHTYADTGTFTIKAKAKDSKGKESGWTGGQAALIASELRGCPDSIAGEVTIPQVASTAVCSSDGHYLYLGHGEYGDSLTVMRLADRRVIGRVRVGLGVLDLASSTNGDRVFAAVEEGNRVVSIRASDREVDDSVLLSDAPAHLAMTNDGRICVAPRAEMRLYLLEADPLRVVDSIDVDALVGDVCAARSEPFAFASLLPRRLGFIDLVNRRMSGTADIGDFTRQVAVAVDDERVFAVNQEDSGFAIVRVADRQIERHIKVGVGESHPDILAMPDSQHVLVSDYYGVRTVLLSAAATDSLHIPGGYPRLALHPNGDTLYAVSGTRVYVVVRRASGR